MKRKNKNKVYVYVLMFLLGFLVAFLLINPSKEVNQISQNVTKEIPKEPSSENRILEGSANIVAVNQNRQGLLGKVNVEITQGNGKILVNTNPFLEPDTQYSANIAASVASNVTGVSLDNKNVIYNFDINGTVLGGPSAGAAMTLATISALENKKLKNIGITGTILPNGEIGEVGAVLEKGEAVATNNLTLFLIPNGEGIFNYYEPVTTKRAKGSFTIISTRYVAKQINVTDYFDKEYGLKVIEISNIQEAMKYAFWTYYKDKWLKQEINTK